LVVVDSKATLRAVVESNLDLLALARWFADQRLTDGGHGGRPPLTSSVSARRHPSMPAGCCALAGRPGTCWPNPGIQIVKSAGMTCVADPYRALCQIRTDQGGGRFTRR
jgi:hypothetical protein